MLKKLIACVFLSCSSIVLASPADVSVMGDVVLFDKPIEIGVTVVEKTYNLVYWAEPLPTEVEGLKSIKKFIQDSRTNNVMIDPFLFQFRFAGIERALQDGTDLTHDDFRQEVDKGIESAVGGKRFLLKCYGYFTSHVVPFCDAYDAEGRSAVLTMIEQGIVVPNPKLGITSDEQKETLQKALESAQKAQVGAWRPFHNMFRGLELG